ncbi:hypothetical protein [Ruegeria arenilitoris]|uniref:hypothetical protein n=1 Tax=Ruegeria arenilitoris TaxID=1173585 RepID=UPI00147FFF3A|nr:hypothetical protein [Ruegeria arenilitoris]
MTGSIWLVVQKVLTHAQSYIRMIMRASSNNGDAWILACLNRAHRSTIYFARS